MKNLYTQSFVNRLESRFSIDSKNMSYTEWLEKNTRLRGKPFSVSGYDFQRQILDDMHVNMDVIKCSQVGMTEVQIRKALAFLIRNNNTSLIFTLPNQDMYTRVSKTRIKPLVENEKVFNPDRSDKPSRSMDLIQVEDSFLYVTQTIEASATSTPCDAVFNDEVDLSDQQSLVLFNSRMQNSDWKINQRFSTPTFPSFGIDLGYQSGDQHTYLCKCPACNHWNDPSFSRAHLHIDGLPDSLADLTEVDKAIVDGLDLQNAFVMCERCHAPLDLGNPSLCQWVPKFPNRKHQRGYRITPFCTPKLGISYIMGQLLKYKEKEFLRGFYNTVLGLPYSDGSIRLDEELIKSAMSESTQGIPISADSNVWIGMDMGKTVHITITSGNDVDGVIAHKFEAVPVERILPYVKELLVKYPNLRGGAVDRHPYTPTANEIFKISEGKIVPVEYRGTKEINLVVDNFERLTHAQVDRTSFLDEVPRLIRNRLLTLSGYGHHRHTLIEHLRDLVRKEEPDHPATWIKLTGNDHWFHSTAFALAAPKIKAVEREKSKEDFRSMALDTVADLDTSTNVRGFTGIGSSRSTRDLFRTEQTGKSIIRSVMH